MHNLLTRRSFAGDQRRAGEQVPVEREQASGEFVAGVTGQLGDHSGLSPATDQRALSSANGHSLPVQGNVESQAIERHAVGREHGRE